MIVGPDADREFATRMRTVFNEFLVLLREARERHIRVKLMTQMGIVSEAFEQHNALVMELIKQYQERL